MENIRIRKVKITTDNKIHLAFEKKGREDGRLGRVHHDVLTAKGG